MSTTAAERLAGLLPCSQCGFPLSAPACGPTHAVLKADPTQHRLVMDALAEALRERPPTFCSVCGPGYRHGDEGCRHTPEGVEVLVDVLATHTLHHQVAEGAGHVCTRVCLARTIVAAGWAPVREVAR